MSTWVERHVIAVYYIDQFDESRVLRAHGINRYIFSKSL